MNFTTEQRVNNCKSYYSKANKCIELHIYLELSNSRQLYNVHKEILDKKPLLIWGQIPDTDLDWIFDKLPHQGLAVNIAVESLDQAERIWNK